MYKIAFEEEAKKEFLNLQKKDKELISFKILDLKAGYFSDDKALKGMHKGKFRKRAGNYRIIYYKENNLLVITIVQIGHRKEVY